MLKEFAKFLKEFDVITLAVGRAKKIASVFVILSLLFFNTAPVFAQLGNITPPPVETPPVVTAPVEPVVAEPEPTPSPVVAPIEEIITPPADTTGPAFISVATASAEESEVTVVWTTDEMAFGYVEYGETASYG